MLIQWIKVKAKKILPIDSVAYRVLRNVFYEYKSLVDFSICKPRFILIENAQKIGGGSELRAILHSYGYEVVARIGGSDDLLKRVEVIDTKSVA